MPIEPLIPRILEHVDLDHWDRPAQLVRLVAQLAVPPLPVPIGRDLLEALDRSPRQAKYDHDVLVRLADRDDVLLRWRGRGRQADAWRINPELARWRHVPWLTPRRTVLAAFFGPLPDEAVRLWAKRAGPGVRLGTDPAPIEVPTPPPSTLNVMASSARHMSTSAQSPGETPPQPVHKRTAPGGPHCFTNSLTSYVEPTTTTAEQENQAEFMNRSAADKLAATVRRVVAGSVYGAPAAELDALAARHAAQIDELCRLAEENLRGFRAPPTAVAYLVRLAAAWHRGDLQPAPPASAPALAPEVRAANLRQRIANLVAVDPDDEHLVALREELDSLSAGG